MKWLERDIHELHLHVGLCVEEKLFHRQMKKLGIKDYTPWLRNGDNLASTHILYSDNKRLALVCMPAYPYQTIEQRHAMLAHEAVHVWQEHVDSIGERSPSAEFMAYGIEAIALKLFNAHRDLTKKKKRKAPPAKKRKARRK